MTDTLRHAGKTVLITGAASGIGLGILDRFLAEGANVTGFDLQPIPRSAERLLALQGVSELIKRVAFLMGLIGDPNSKEKGPSAEEELAAAIAAAKAKEAK